MADQAPQWPTCKFCHVRVIPGMTCTFTVCPWAKVGPTIISPGTSRDIPERGHGGHR